MVFWQRCRDSQALSPEQAEVGCGPRALLTWAGSGSEQVPASFSSRPQEARARQHWQEGWHLSPLPTNFRFPRSTQCGSDPAFQARLAWSHFLPRVPGVIPSCTAEGPRVQGCRPTKPGPCWKPSPFTCPTKMHNVAKTKLPASPLLSPTPSPHGTFLTITPS